MALGYHEINITSLYILLLYRPKDCLVEQQISTYQN